MISRIAGRIRFYNNEYVLGKQLRFFFPLIVTAFVLSFTGSLINAGLARLPSPVIYLSAYAVAKSFMSLFQSPLHMIRPMVTALATNGKNYIQVRKFTIIIALIIVALMTMVAATGLAKLVFNNIMGLQGETLEEAVKIFWVFILYPVGLLLKDFYHGILLKFNKSFIIPVNSFIRIVGVWIMVISIDKLSFIPAPFLAGAILIVAVYTEGFLSMLGAQILIKDIPKAFDESSNAKGKEKREPMKDLTGKFIFTFYWPLIITSFLKTLNIPFINAALARTVSPEVAISTYSVAWGLCTMLVNPLSMFHQVPLNFIDEENPRSNIAVKISAGLLGGLFSFILIIIGFTNIGYYVLMNLIGVDKNIATMSMDVLKVGSVLPLLTILRELFAGVLMKNHLTKPLGAGKTISLIVLVVVVLMMIWIQPSNPALVGIVAVVVSQCVELLCIYLASRKAINIE